MGRTTTMRPLSGPICRVQARPPPAGQRRDRPALLNAYDNTIVYTDHVLAELIGRLRAVDYHAALIYSSDHGEDIFDDAATSFLHRLARAHLLAAPRAVAGLYEPGLRRGYPALRANALRNRPKRVSTSKSYAPTLLHLAGIDTRYNNDTLSLLSPLLRTQTKLKYLTDLDESVDLDEWGFSDYDKHQLKIMNGYEQQETHHYPRTGMPVGAILPAQAETIEPLPFGSMDSWVTRIIKESAVLGGHKQTVYAIGPERDHRGLPSLRARQGQPLGLVQRAGQCLRHREDQQRRVAGTAQRQELCAVLSTKIEHCKAIGLVNIDVLVSGSIFLGRMFEPIRSTSNPYAKMEMGIGLQQTARLPAVSTINCIIPTRESSPRPQVPRPHTMPENRQGRGVYPAAIPVKRQQGQPQRQARGHRPRAIYEEHQGLGKRPPHQGDVWRLTHWEGYQPFMGLFLPRRATMPATPRARWCRCTRWGGPTPLHHTHPHAGDGLVGMWHRLHRYRGHEILHRQPGTGVLKRR